MYATIDLLYADRFYDNQTVEGEKTCTANIAVYIMRTTVAKTPDFTIP